MVPTKGEHRIIVDVHGSYCSLIEEAKTVSGQVSECRARRTQLSSEIQSASDAESATATALLSVILVGTLRVLIIVE
ncbi:hypothetical protein KIN20_015010 [Parelaphostrongylus tenuis]|uniref:Uncharacterized protein n=1 Tax=Parelaphostrongylus tenuis TaxID=148309 RepID=A0AAD5QNP8_PARTN|nr:hypothetical protein KIN20_015010 [Parelaphostrongylus tenuis]